MLSGNKKIFNEQGYLFMPGFFSKEMIQEIRNEAKSVFAVQMKRSRIVVPEFDDEIAFSKAMYSLFEKDMEAFVNCGKTAQHTFSLHALGVSDSVKDFLKKELQVNSPVVCTRPVLFFNHKNLAKKDVYHTVFPHQDWRSMQGSLDSVVLWLPLIDIDVNLGALEIIPGSHKWGLVTSEVIENFGAVSLTDEQKKMFMSVPVKTGDALFFSSFLVHQSGNNSTDRIRWSCHFRFNNLEEETFVERKYAHPYIYKPDERLITPGFPEKNDIDKIFEAK